MKLKFGALSLVLISSLIGCTHSNNENVLKTDYFENDYNSQGNLKSILEYDYSVESSHCGVIPELKLAMKDTLYKVELEKEDKKAEFLFECRMTYINTMEKQRRLFLIGSYADCNNRSWNYSGSILPEYRKIANTCRSRSNTYNGHKEVEKKWHNFIGI